MARKTTDNVRISVNVVTGAKPSGANKITARNISDINPAISAENAFAVAKGYGELQSHEVDSYKMTEVSTLTEN